MRFYQVFIKFLSSFYQVFVKKKVYFEIMSPRGEKESEVIAKKIVYSSFFIVSKARMTKLAFSRFAPIISIIS